MTRLTYLLFAMLLAIGAAHAVTDTFSLNLNETCADTNETAVSTITRVFADTDGQQEYNWTEQLNGTVLSDHPSGQDQQVIFAGGDGGIAELTVNGKFPGQFYAGNMNQAFPTYLQFPPMKDRDAYHEETLVTGDNNMSVRFLDAQPSVAEGELVIIFAGVICNTTFANELTVIPDFPTNETNSTTPPQNTTNETLPPPPQVNQTLPNSTNDTLPPPVLNETLPVNNTQPVNDTTPAVAPAKKKKSGGGGGAPRPSQMVFVVNVTPSENSTFPPKPPVTHNYSTVVLNEDVHANLTDLLMLDNYSFTNETSCADGFEEVNGTCTEAPLIQPAPPKAATPEQLAWLVGIGGTGGLGVLAWLLYGRKRQTPPTTP